MNPHYVLFVDLPLHSSHAFPSPSSAESTHDSDLTVPVLPQSVSSISSEILRRIKSSETNLNHWNASLLVYPTPSSIYHGYFHTPWTNLLKLTEFQTQAKPLPSKDPFSHFLEQFFEIPSSATSEVIWILHEARLISATNLSYRLCQILRHMQDVKGIKTKIVFAEDFQLPLNFERVFSSLNVDLYTSPSALPLDRCLSVRFQTSSHPYSSSSACISHISDPSRLELKSWSYGLPVAFQLINTILLAKIPLHLLDEHVDLATMRYSATEDPNLIPEGFALFVRPLLRSLGADTPLPEWKDEICAWEYPKNCTLPLGDTFVLFKDTTTIFIRKLNVSASAFDHWLSKPNNPLNTQALAPMECHSPWTFIQLKDDLDDLIGWVAKQTWIAVNPEAALDPAITLDGQSNSLRAVAAWFDSESTSQHQTFLASCRRYASQLLYHLSKSNMEAQTSGIVSSINGSGFENNESMDLDTPPVDEDDASLMNLDVPIPDFSEAESALSFNMDSVPMIPFPGAREALFPDLTLLNYLKSDDRMHFSLKESLQQLWSQVLVNVTKMEPFTPGLASSVRRRSLGRSSGLISRDDVSVTSSDATSEAGQALLDAVRKPASSAVPIAPNTSNKLKSSKQLRQELSSLSRPARTSLSSVVSSIEARRRTSLGSATSTLSNGSSPRVQPESSLMSAPVAQPRVKTTTSQNPLSSPVKPKTPAKGTQIPTSSTMSFPSHPASARTSLGKTSKLPPLAAPPLRTSTGLTPSASTNYKKVDYAKENQDRLLSCCKAEMGKFLKSSDTRFNSLVNTLATICKAIASVHHDWNASAVSSAELAKVASQHASQLVSPGNSTM